jgi:hypothetical protein
MSLSLLDLPKFLSRVLLFFSDWPELDFCDVVDKELVSNSFGRASSFRSGFFVPGNTRRFLSLKSFFKFLHFPLDNETLSQ